MMEYIKKGWQGELTFSQILFGTESGFYLLEGGAAYIGFYLLFFIVLINQGFNFNNIYLYPFLLYGIGFYIWSLKAFWGSAHHATNRFSALLIRIFTILLPVFSIISFIVIILYYLIKALIEALN